MNIGALPRRFRPQVTRIGTTVRFILKAPYLGGLIGARPYLGSSACQAQLARALDHENRTLLGHDFAMLRDCLLVIALSCTHDKLRPRSHSPAVASKPGLLRTKHHGSYAACETV